MLWRGLLDLGNVDILIHYVDRGSGNPSHTIVNVSTTANVNDVVNSSIVPLDVSDTMNICVVTDVANELVNNTPSAMNESIMHAAIAVDLMADSVNIVDSFVIENKISEVVAIEGEVVISEFDDEWH